MNSPADLIQRAEICLRSAHALIGLSDLAGAANRFYYAMLHAVRAVLAGSGIEAPRTHNGVHAAFALHFVKTKKVDAELSRMLSKAEYLRLLADYDDGAIAAEDLTTISAAAERFVSAMRELVVDPTPPASGSSAPTSRSG